MLMQNRVMEIRRSTQAQAWRCSSYSVLLLFAATSSFALSFELSSRRLKSRGGSFLAATVTHRDDSDGVQVYDNVFSQKTCELLHELAEEHGSSIFLRNTQEEQLLTPLEHALDSFLHAIGDDDNDVVEYWSRQEYINLHAHSDVDEDALEDDGILRYPEFAHVLYLQKDEQVKGAPTCVFPAQLGGWTPTSSSTSSSSATSSSDPWSLVTVPAVQGRVLRFSGSAMHAVPKPATRWLLSKQEEKELRAQENKNCGEEEEEEEYSYAGRSVKNLDEEDDDIFEDEEDEDYEERSVILFNTWKDQGPRGVSRDCTTGILPDGIELDDVDDEMYLKQQRTLQEAEWEEEYDVNCKSLWCQSMDSWKRVSILDNDDSSKDDTVVSTAVRVPLMGNQERRLHPRKVVSLKSSPKLKEGLEDETLPMKFHIREENTKYEC